MIFVPETWQDREHSAVKKNQTWNKSVGNVKKVKPRQLSADDKKRKRLVSQFFSAPCNKCSNSEKLFWKENLFQFYSEMLLLSETKHVLLAAQWTQSDCQQPVSLA